MPDRTPAHFARLRRRMVEDQLKARGIVDPRVLDAMAHVPRDLFIPAHLRHDAYEDGPLPIGEGQTISQPYIVAFMAEACELMPGDRVLEIGTGSGYGAAVLGRIVESGCVITIERHAPLAARARAALAEADIDNVEVIVGDGTLGYPEAAPFDAIVATAGGPAVPDALKAQLGVGGRLVMPVGESRTYQQIVRIRRNQSDEFTEEKLTSVRFVPLIGEQGWS